MCGVCVCLSGVDSHLNIQGWRYRIENFKFASRGALGVFSHSFILYLCELADIKRGETQLLKG